MSSNFKVSENERAMEKESAERFERVRESKYELLRQEMINERDRAGLKQVDVSARLNKPQSYVSKVERGERKIDVVEFVEFAEAVGFDPLVVLKKLIES